MSHARRWSFRRLLLICLAILCVGIPTLLTHYHFIRNSIFVYRSKEIRLEEFSRFPLRSNGAGILQTRVIPPSEYWRVVLSMPPVPDASAYMEAMCYSPHHRIVMRGMDGSTHQVEVCFECSKMRFDAAQTASLPFIWWGTLQLLFDHYGMPERTTEEYSKLSYANESNQTTLPEQTPPP